MLATTNHINAKNQKIVDAYNDVKAIFSRTKSARLYVVSPSGNVAKTSVGSEYSVNPAQTKEMLDSYTEGVSDYYTYLDSAYHSTLNLPLRENAAKYCFNIDEKGTYCFDFAYQLPDLLGKAQINTSIINPYTEIGSLYFTMATSTGGELFYDTTNFANDVINHMYSNNGANYYDIISATGLKNIHLNGKLTRSNEIDTDGDGLTDLDETDTESGLITWDKSGNIVLPTFAKCMEVEGDKYFYVKSGLDRFINGYANYLHYLYNKRILPIKSDPTSLDSDGDGYNDNVDPRPLVCDVFKSSLSNKDFLPIYNEDGTLDYGGDQNWFNSAIGKNGGCGTVAASNLLAYGYK